MSFNILGLHKNLDNEALVPCLFFLPPIGFLVLGILIAKIMQYFIVIFFVKKRFRKMSKLKKGP